MNLKIKADLTFYNQKTQIKKILSFFYNPYAVKSPVIQAQHEIVSCQMLLFLFKYSVTNVNIISCYVVLYKPKTWCKFCS